MRLRRSSIFRGETTSSAVSYLAAVLTGGIVQAIARGDGFAWFGFNWSAFLTSVVVRWALIAVFAGPFFLVSVILSDGLGTRNALLYCCLAVMSGSFWLWAFIIVAGSADGETVWESYSGALPATIISGLAGGLVQWATRERVRPFP